MTPTSSWTLRPLGVADVDQVLRIQAACYGAALVEGRAVFQRRLAAPHHCSWGAAADGAGLAAYLAAYWSQPGKLTPLHGEFAAPQAQATPVLYLHDMAVAPTAAGQGLARRLLEAAWAQARARGVRHAALVSVQDSQTYWLRQGFAVAPVADALQAAHLASYGPGAVYMQRVLPE